MRKQMTYREMLAKLTAMTPKQLDKQALYQDTNSGEFFGVCDIVSSEEYGGMEVGLSESQFLLRIEQ